MLDAGVFSFRVLSYQYSVHVVVRGFVACNGFAGADVCEEIEGSTEGKIEGYVAFAYRCLDQVSSILSETIVWSRTAKGPFSATKFFSTLSTALSGMTVLPFLRWGVTSTDSHSIGA